MEEIEYISNRIEIYNWVFYIKYSRLYWLYIEYERNIDLPKKITFKDKTYIFGEKNEYISFSIGAKNCIQIVKDNPIYDMCKNIYIKRTTQNILFIEKEILQKKKDIETLQYNIELINNK